MEAWASKKKEALLKSCTNLAPWLNGNRIKREWMQFEIYHLRYQTSISISMVSQVKVIAGRENVRSTVQTGGYYRGH